MDLDLIGLLRRHAEERRESVVAYMTSGAAKDYSEYREQVGALKELNILSAELDELEKRYLEE
jgi:hypothetical protein